MPTSYLQIALQIGTFKVLTLTLRIKLEERKLLCLWPDFRQCLLLPYCVAHAAYGAWVWSAVYSSSLFSDNDRIHVCQDTLISLIPPEQTEQGLNMWRTRMVLPRCRARTCYVLPLTEGVVQNYMSRPGIGTRGSDQQPKGTNFWARGHSNTGVSHPRVPILGRLKCTI